MSNIADFNPLRAWDGNGVPVSGAQAWFYFSGTDQRRAIYADTGATVEHPQPLIADAAGVFPAVYVEGADPVRVEVRDADGVMLPGYPIDPARVASIDGGTASGIAFEPTDEIPATNVQQAIEMVRTGAIEPVVDLGLGVTGNGPLLENINATGTASGIYRVTSSTTGTWPSGVAAGDGIVLLERHSSLKATQTLKMIGGGIYVRRLNSTWGAWAQLLDASSHSQATWNAGTDATPRAIAPSVLKSWRDTWATAWGHAQSVWNTGTDTGLRAISPKILTDWLKAKIGTPGSTGLSLLAATSASAARTTLQLTAGATAAARSQSEWNAGTVTTESIISPSKFKAAFTSLFNAAFNAQALGVNQTWHDYGSSGRAHSVSYRNTTSRPIMVTIVGDAIDNNRPLQVSTNGSTWINVGWFQEDGRERVGLSIIVPAGSYYRINGNTGINSWAELR